MEERTFSKTVGNNPGNRGNSDRLLEELDDARKDTKSNAENLDAISLIL